MSVREREDERQKNCPSRGLGLAAAAIGVGVGAALYYFFNKRAENPDAAGATSSGWTCEQPLSRQSPSPSLLPSSDDYSTVSEHSTTDTSMCDDSDYDDDHSHRSPSHQSSSSSSSSSTSTSDTYSTADDDDDLSSISELTIDSYCSEPEEIVTVSDSDELDSELDTDWDVTRNSLGVPRSTEAERSPSPLQRFVTSLNSFISPRNRPRRVRQRTWSLEECSICCEIMLKDQPLRQLACSHNFHAACVGPWLEEHQTCPNCRKLA